MPAPPREIAPGVFWLTDCLKYRYGDTYLHAYNAAYLVTGADRSALIEGGHPVDLPVLERQLEELFAAGASPLEYVFATHTETAHSTGIGRVLQHYPAAVVVGDVSDLHLVFPECADRLRPLVPGQRIDLGGTELLAVDAVFRDMHTTRWAFDTSRKVLFTSDGMAHTHYHLAGHCGSFAEEAPDLALPDMTALFAEYAFAWTRFSDVEPYIARMDELIFRELGATMIAPTHGLVISDPAATLPRVYEGLRLGNADLYSRP